MNKSITFLLLLFFFLSSHVLLNSTTINSLNDLSSDKIENEKKVKSKKEKFFIRNYIGFYGAVGYYFPMAQWWEIVTGVINVETGIKAVRLKPIFKSKIINLVLRPGFSVSYSFGINKPGYNNIYYNSILFKLPLDLCIELSNMIALTAGTGIQLQLDVFSYKHSDGTTSNYISPAFGLFVSTGFEYYFGQNRLIGIGCRNIFNFVFYDIFYTDYKLQVCVLYKFKKK